MKTMRRMLPLSGGGCLFLLPLLLYKVDGFVMERRRRISAAALLSSNTKAPVPVLTNETEALLGPAQSSKKDYNKSQNYNNRIIFGTAALGKAAQPLALLDAAYDKGIRRFDLARSYGCGASERLFGAWLEEHDVNRASVEIITKGGMGQDKYGDPHRPVLTRPALLAEVQTSLEALRTHYVDLYMFHRDDPRIPVETFVLWANELVQRGTTRRWGVSNWTFERFRQAFDFATRNGLEPPRANSPQFSLAVPQCEVWPTTHSISGSPNDAQQDWYERNHIELLCWEVLAKGFMAQPHLWSEGTVNALSFDDHVNNIGSDEWRLHRIQKAYCYDENYHRRRAAMQLARQLGCKLSQVAILYVLFSRGTNLSVIVGTNNLYHVDDMVGLDACQLDEDTRLQLARLAIAPKTSSSSSPHLSPRRFQTTLKNAKLSP